jgi:energy-coupling factor transporter transmembrane protein EcfT
MSLRARVLVFVLSLMVLSIVPPPDPWPIIIGGAIYLLVVWPKIDR